MKCVGPLHHLLVTNPTTVMSPSMCIPKIAATSATNVCSSFQLRTSLDRDFCSEVVWLPAAIGSVQNYKAIILKTGNVS